MDLDGIFLDLYGTLTAGDRQAVESVCEDIVREHALTISAYELSINWGERFFNSLDNCSGQGFKTLFDVEIQTLRETMAALRVDVDARRYTEKLQQYWKAPPPQPEVQEFIAAIDLPICIVSNADHADALMALARCEVKAAHVVTSEQARSYKPDRAIFEIALRRTGWRRDRVIHVGDSLHSDVGGAMVAGIKSGWVNRAHRIHDIGTHLPDHEFEDLMGLVELVHRKKAN